MKQIFNARFRSATALMSMCALGLVTVGLADGKLTSIATSVASGKQGLVKASVTNGKQDFTLHNDTGMVISELYISAHEKDDWEEDLLGVDVLGDGEETEVTFDPNEEADEWDLKIVDDKGKDWVWSNLNLTDIIDIKLYIDSKGVRRAHLKKVQ